MKRWVPVVAAIIFSMVVAMPALAKGPPSKVTITGPGLQNVEITAPELLANLDLVALLDGEQLAPPASTNLADGYQILFWYKDEQGVLWPAFDVYYFPSTTNTAGTIFNRSAAKGPWYYTKPQGDAVVKQLLAQHHSTRLPSAGAFAPRWQMLALVGGCIVVGGMMSVAVRRRVASNP